MCIHFTFLQIGLSSRGSSPLQSFNTLISNTMYPQNAVVAMLNAITAARAIATFREAFVLLLHLMFQYPDGRQKEQFWQLMLSKGSLLIEA